MIRTIRGLRVMLDSDLAAIYGVSTKRLNEQVKRNLERFPADFMFQLTAKESAALRSQIATGSQKHRDPRLRPYAFTEYGALMAVWRDRGQSLGQSSLLTLITDVRSDK